MSVIRVVKNNNYTVMSNAHLHDKRLSLKAVGLLSIVLSLPNDWHYTVKGLVGSVKDGERAVNGALSELKKCGYLQVNKLYPNSERSKIEYQYVFYEKPQGIQNVHLEQDLQNVGLQNVDLQNVGLQNVDLQNVGAYINTNKQSTNKQNTKELNTNKEKTIKKESIDSVIHNYTNSEELVSALLDFKEMRKVLKKPLTPRAMKQCLKKLDGLDEKSKVKVVLQSVEHGWMTFYELKDIKSFTKNGTTVPQWYTKTEQHVASDELKDEVEDMLRNLGG
jgi:hypothetical protein